MLGRHRRHARRVRRAIGTAALALTRTVEIDRWRVEKTAGVGVEDEPSRSVETYRDDSAGRRRAAGSIDGYRH